jgi:hypothetical protein
MGLRSPAVFLVAALLLGCAGANGRAGKQFNGDAQCAPALEALPSLDVADAQLSSQMKMARLLTAESLALAAPRSPATDSAALARWSDSELKTWLSEKHRRAEAARKELDRAALVSHRERILAGALVGLVYEDMARALLGLPYPAELASEPEVRRVFEDVLHAQATPYLVHARLAYQACAANALGLSPMTHWSEFCEGRRAELPVPPSAAQEDGTTVEVTASAR